MHPRAATQIGNLLKSLNDGYEGLSKLQADAAVGKPTPHFYKSKCFDLISTGKFFLSRPRLDEAAVKAKTVEITKLDVALNNAIVRAKTPVCT